MRSQSRLKQGKSIYVRAAAILNMVCAIFKPNPKNYPRTLQFQPLGTGPVNSFLFQLPGSIQS